MKKTVFILSLLVMIVSCNSRDTANKTQSESTVTKEDPRVANGLQLVAKSDCFTCHKVADKFTGPSYFSVAEKYPDNEESIKYLSEKIQKGGSGVWGTIPMLPHPEISKDDAEQMAIYILSLK